jgi:hypothetical protein
VVVARHDEGGVKIVVTGPKFVDILINCTKWKEMARYALKVGVLTIQCVLRF